ncbi:hypothetical protein [Bradyrhizobium sp. STM 3557]|uniref:hypothetical protein n=1 Tax=Bradyrhizobium sp. STM 3557 TaxID=578920 RepID=UPI00388EE3B5
MADAPVARAIALPTAQSGFAVCVLTLLCAVFLQKIALPGTGGLYPLNLLVFPAVTLAAFLGGVLEVHTRAFVWYALVVCLGTLSTALSPSPHISVLSLGFFVVAQGPLAFRGASEISSHRVMKLVSTVGCVTAVIGVLQFIGQFIVGADVAFFLDKHLPENVTVAGYNSLIPLYWSSPIFKSNGVVFLEPSFFCQFLAIAFVAELVVGATGVRLILLSAGLLCSYSGTGLTMLALFLPFYFLHHGHIRLFLFAALLCLVLISLGDTLSLDAFTRRLSEFSDVQSSGWARFFSMFSVLQKVVFANDLTFFLGRGPGTVQEQFRLFSFNAFDPTWGKVIYEYGLFGSLAYFRFLYVAACRGPKGLRFAVGYTYLFLGGYLLNPSILMLLAGLLVWPGKTSFASERSRGTAMEETGRSPVPALGTR